MSAATVRIQVNMNHLTAALKRAGEQFRYVGWEFTRHRWQEGPEFWPPALRDAVTTLGGAE